MDITEEYIKGKYKLPEKKKKKKAKYLPQIVKDIQKHIPHTIDYSSQKNISYSQLSLFSQCEKRWSLQYREGHKKFQSSVSTVFGTAIHHALQLYLTTMYEQSIAEADRIELITVFEDKLRDEYLSQYKKNNNQHFTKVEDLREHFDDGVEIINYFRKNIKKYFSKRGWYLVGCEIPIVVTPNPKLPNVVFGGFIDAVLYNELTETFTIIDFKTSKMGWGNKEKKDKSKQHQLVLYKNFFKEQFNVPFDKIDVEFFILKRKLYDNPEFPSKRIQRFLPPHGKTSVNQAKESLDNFINKAFDKNGYVSKEYEAKPDKFNCKFCPFAFTQHCNKAIM